MHVHHGSFWPVVYLWALVCTFSRVNNIDLSLPTVRPGMLLLPTEVHTQPWPGFRMDLLNEVSPHRAIPL